MIKWFRNIISTLFSKDNSFQKKRSAKKIRFERIIQFEKTPSNTEIKENDFVEVNYKGKSYWALFLCPCGCESVVSLSLQAEHHPKWSLCESINGRPTLRPSVWQNSGCYSHYWVEDGIVEWCENTGCSPDTDMS